MIGQRALDHEPGLLDAELDRGRADRPAPAARRAPGDAEHADAMHVAEIVLHLGQLGVAFRLHVRAPPRSTSMSSGSPALALTTRCMSVKVSILRPLIETIRSPGLKPAACAALLRLHGIDAGGRCLLAVEGEHGREDHDRQDEVRDRPGRDDRGALADRLEEEALAPLRLAHVADRFLIRHARGVLVAEELDVAAERDGRDLPARAVAIVEAEQFRAEADREGEHAHAAPARDQEMAELVKEHHDGQHEQERHDIAGRASRPRSRYLPKMSITSSVPADLP